MSSVFDFTDYSSEVDVYFLRSESAERFTRVDQDIFRNGGEPVSGLRKLAQQVVLRMFTPSGSHLYEPDEGSALMTDVLAQRVKTTEQARQSFAKTREDVLRQFNIDRLRWPNMPADETLVNMTLLSVNINRDTLELGVQITSLAGQSSVLAVPIVFN